MRDQMLTVCNHMILFMNLFNDQSCTVAKDLILLVILSLVGRNIHQDKQK